MGREQYYPFVAAILDDGCGVVDPADQTVAHNLRQLDDTYLVGWQVGFEPMFVAVRSFLGCPLDMDEVEEIAMEYLLERSWFDGEPTSPDFLIAP